MFRRNLLAAAAGLTVSLFVSAGFMGPAIASDRVESSTALIGEMITDLETFLATDTGETEARKAEISRVLDTYFDMASITRFSAGQYWRAATPEEHTQYGALFTDVLIGTIVRNFDQLKGLAYSAGKATEKGDKFVIVSGTFTDTTGDRPPVAVNWRVLAPAGEQAKVFDIEIENLSLLVTQKQENVAVIRKNKGKFAALIEVMKERAANRGKDS